MNTPSISELTSSARIIAEVIGVPDTLKLCRALFSGRDAKLHVPAVVNMTPEHRISQVIGFEQACRLALYFGGERIYVPSTYAERRAAIWADFMADMSIAAIAEKYSISERRVCQITAEERNFSRTEHSRQIGSKRTPAKAAAARRYGTLGGNKNTMLKAILSTFKREPETPYGALFSSIRAFNPKLTLLLAEDKASEVTIERAIELMVPCLPGEMTIKYGDSASLMILKPAKNAQRSEPLMIRVETPLTPKSMSQNSVVISMLEALAVSAVIDKMSFASGQPVPAEARN